MRPVILACIAFLLAVVVGICYGGEMRLAALKYAAANPALAAWDIEDAIYVRAGKVEEAQTPRTCLSLEADWYIDKLGSELLTGINIINRCAEFVDVTDVRMVLPIVGTYGSILPAKAMVVPISHKHGIRDMRKNIFLLDRNGEDCKTGAFADGSRCHKAPLPPGRALFIEMLLPAKEGFIVQTADGKKMSGKLTGR